MHRLTLLLAFALLALPRLSLADPVNGILTQEFIYDANPPTPSCHASTIEQTPDGLVAAWFGGTRERAPDVGIWVSLKRNGKWSAPVEVANGVQPQGPRLPCWNPVLFQQPNNGPLQLFYKLGPTPHNWWGMLIESTDSGKTWSKPRRLPDGILGPIKDKPVLIGGNTLLCPSSLEEHGRSVHLERTTDQGKTWSKTPPIDDPHAFGAIQPTILDHGPAGLQILCRSKKKQIVESWSHDAGKTWSPLAATKLPNPDSGIDAVQLNDGRSVLVYNDTTAHRTPLNIATSQDGKTWTPGPVLESAPGEYSYPAIIQTDDGLLHITYTWKRQRIKHVVIDPSKL